MEKGYFSIGINLDVVDEKLRKLVQLRNEMAFLAKELDREIGFEMLELKSK